VHSNGIPVAVARLCGTGHKHDHNPMGHITNSDLKMAGLVMIGLAIEGVHGLLVEKYLALFNDNPPTISWVTKLASKRSTVAKHLLQALALHAKIAKGCNFTPIHVKGKQKISDMPSRSFGSSRM
jgi:hypothetical protein